MSKKLFYPLLLLALFGVACIKETATSIPASGPSGTFTGQFRLLRRSTDKVPFDTTKANLSITLNSVSNSFAIGGDTTIVHAGSHGSYTISAPFINFTDQTLSKTSAQAKAHLSGLYQYYYDGTVFQLLAYSADTLSLQYDFKRTQ